MMTSCNESEKVLSSILFELEDLQFQIAATLNALDASHVAMSCGEYKAEGFLAGLFEIHNHLSELNLKSKDKLSEARTIRKQNTVN